jgi:hypothetical protein
MGAGSGDSTGSVDLLRVGKLGSKSLVMKLMTFDTRGYDVECAAKTMV